MIPFAQLHPVWFGAIATLFTSALILAIVAMVEAVCSSEVEAAHGAPAPGPAAPLSAGPEEDQAA